MVQGDYIGLLLLYLRALKNSEDLPMKSGLIYE